MRNVAASQRFLLTALPAALLRRPRFVSRENPEHAAERVGTPEDKLIQVRIGGQPGIKTVNSRCTSHAVEEGRKGTAVQCLRKSNINSSARIAKSAPQAEGN